MSVEAVSSSSLSRPPAQPLGRVEPHSARQRKLKTAVDELVGTLFFGQVFKMVRESSLKGKYGHGGRGEEIFSAQLHDLLAKKMGRSSNLGISDAIYKRYVAYVGAGDGTAAG
jgi:hypothetical protein